MVVNWNDAKGMFSIHLTVPFTDISLDFMMPSTRSGEHFDPFGQ